MFSALKLDIPLSSCNNTMLSSAGVNVHSNNSVLLFVCCCMQCCRCRMCLHVLCTLHMFTMCGWDRPTNKVRTVDRVRVNGW